MNNLSQGNNFMDTDTLKELTKPYSRGNNDVFDITVDGYIINPAPLTHCQAVFQCERALKSDYDHKRVNLVNVR